MTYTKDISRFFLLMVSTFRPPHRVFSEQCKQIRCNETLVWVGTVTQKEIPRLDFLQAVHGKYPSWPVFQQHILNTLNFT